jgi:hypothetical protein
VRNTQNNRDVDDFYDPDDYRLSLDIRDRLDDYYFYDEPKRSEFEPFHEVMRQVYASKPFTDSVESRRQLVRAYRLLMANKHLPKSLYQKVRFDYLLGVYFQRLGEFGKAATQRGKVRAFTKAADHFRHAAATALRIPNRILSTQLKARESDVCYRAPSYSRLYVRAFETARDALNAWPYISALDERADLEFGFKLADAVGARGQVVAEDEDAVDAMDRAALLLLLLQAGEHDKTVQYANNDLFLQWNWTYLCYTMGRYREAFKRVLVTRRKGKDLLEPVDRVRLQCLIADIVLACAEEGAIVDYSRKRLLSAGDVAIQEARRLMQELKEAKDPTGYALTLLAEARWMALSNEGRSVDRLAKITDAQAIAQEQGEELLLARVAIAIGDEYAYQYSRHRFQKKLGLAQTAYKEAEQLMTDLQVLSLARVASRRLEQLDSLSRHPKVKPIPRKRIDPPSQRKIDQN